MLHAAMLPQVDSGTSLQASGLLRYQSPHQQPKQLISRRRSSRSKLFPMRPTEWAPLLAAPLVERPLLTKLEGKAPRRRRLLKALNGPAGRSASTLTVTKSSMCICSLNRCRALGLNPPFGEIGGRKMTSQDFKRHPCRTGSRTRSDSSEKKVVLFFKSFRFAHASKTPARSSQNTAWL
jgi:hypothetical protein